MRHCYVLDKTIFKIIAFEKNKLTNGFIEFTDVYLKYELPNGILFQYTPKRINLHSTHYHETSSSLQISYNDAILRDEKKLVPVNIAEFMNQFASLKQAEIDELVKKTQQQIKTELEDEIDQLRVEKSELENSVEKLKRIMKIKEELYQLLKEL